MLLALIILYVVTLLYLSIVERFRHYAALVGLQGWLLLGVALFRLHTIDWPELIFILAETLVFKAIIVPVLLTSIIRRTGIDRVHVASVATFNQLLLSLLALLCSIVITYCLADTQIDRVFFGVALYGLLSGMLLIVNHKRIFSHLVGFLVGVGVFIEIERHVDVRQEMGVNVGINLCFTHHPISILLKVASYVRLPHAWSVSSYNSRLPDIVAGVNVGNSVVVTST